MEASRHKGLERLGFRLDVGSFTVGKLRFKVIEIDVKQAFPLQDIDNDSVKLSVRLNVQILRIPRRTVSLIPPKISKYGLPRCGLRRLTAGTSRKSGNAECLVVKPVNEDFGLCLVKLFSQEFELSLVLASRPELDKPGLANVRKGSPFLKFTVNGNSQCLNELFDPVTGIGGDVVNLVKKGDNCLKTAHVDGVIPVLNNRNPTQHIRLHSIQTGSRDEIVMSLLRGHQLPGLSTRQTEDILLSPHIELDLPIHRDSIDTHHRGITRPQRIADKGRTGVKGISLERYFRIVIGFDIQDTLADCMKPVSSLVVSLILPRPIQELIQFLYLSLYALPSGRVVDRGSQEVPVLKCGKLLCVVLLHDIQDVFPDILRPAQDRLNTTPIPVQELFLHHVLDVEHQSRVQFLHHILRSDIVHGGIDIQPPVEIITDYAVATLFKFSIFSQWTDLLIVGIATESRRKGGIEWVVVYDNIVIM